MEELWVRLYHHAIGKKSYIFTHRPHLVQSLAARGPRLKQTQASWALLFGLSVSVPPTGNSGRFLVGWSTAFIT